ncbi:uncharacterized protein RSE6_08818 [Rhynchosporium secalis]|uniref:CFEM domain-containing protein n=1 Tax=Rhynchosporium secalis TaxID=38038 RepID=A0A1E1MGH6_RHYSE|nr:uncharacterized protein RSE6_08818 [Rhynchosporium secalis]
MSVSLLGAFIALSNLLIPFAQAQFVADLPQCIQDCINQSPDTDCTINNIGCICRASSGNFLPDVVTCMHSTCDGHLDTKLLLTPLQLACMIAGSPIPASAIRNAENAASSLATQVTTTVTQNGSSANGGAGATTTIYVPSPSVSTVTVTTTRSGSTFYQIYPVTIGSTTAITGPTSTLTSISTPSPTNGGFTGIIPIVVVGTDSARSTYTSTRTQPGAISSYTTTDSRGNTITQQSTFPESTTASVKNITSGDGSSSTIPSSSAGSSQSTIVTVTSATAATTSSNGLSSSQTSKAPIPDQTNSAPFGNSNDADALTTENRLGLVVLLAVLCMWL